MVYPIIYRVLTIRSVVQDFAGPSTVSHLFPSRSPWRLTDNLSIQSQNCLVEAPGDSLIAHFIGIILWKRHHYSSHVVPPVIYIYIIYPLYSSYIISTSYPHYIPSIIISIFYAKYTPITCFAVPLYIPTIYWFSIPVQLPPLF